MDIDEINAWNVTSTEIVNGSFLTITFNYMVGFSLCSDGNVSQRSQYLYWRRVNGWWRGGRCSQTERDNQKQN